ncbi:hypothetical protein FGLOB1_14696 [Fusarium globosum]|uniref:Uncharacterized protein n=1 Tax=Fusarium globosum TaxID=78864 RepID=A0A8H5UER3_9HYPO|nr:hypothetical protein FGLOB1_14696 [Fusarium globosum]
MSDYSALQLTDEGFLQQSQTATPVPTVPQRAGGRYAEPNEKPNPEKGIHPQRTRELNGAQGLQDASDHPDSKLNEP